MALSKQEMDQESVEFVPVREVMIGLATGLVNVNANILNDALNNSLNNNNILDHNPVVVAL